MGWNPPSVIAWNSNLGYVGSTTFSSVALGTAYADRIIVAAIVNTGGFGNLTATVNGNAMTIAETDASSPSAALLIYQDDGALGTSTSFVVSNDSGGLYTVGLAVGSLTGFSPTVTSVAAFPSGTATDPQTTTTALTVSDGGIGLVCVLNGGGTVGTFNVGTLDIGSNDGGSAPNMLVGNIAVAGSQTPSVSGYDFEVVAIASATWGPSGGDTLMPTMPMLMMRRKSLGWTPPLVDHRRRTWRRERGMLVPDRAMIRPTTKKAA